MGSDVNQVTSSGNNMVDFKTTGLSDEEFFGAPQDKGQKATGLSDEEFFKAEAPVAPAEERGIVGDTFSHLARGGAKAVEQIGRGLQVADLDYGDDKGALDSIGRRLQKFGEKAPTKYEFLKPDKSEASGDESWFKQKVMEGVESFGPSSVPFVAAAGVGVTAVAAGASAPVTGTIAALTGVAALFGTFGAGTYHEKREQYDKHDDLTEDQKHDAALKNAGVEAGGELVSDVILWGAGKMIPGAGKVVGDLAKNGIRSLLKLSPKQAAKNMAKVYAAEWGTETGQQYVQSGIDASLGVGDRVTMLEAAIDTAIPTAVMTLAFGLGSQAYNMRERKKLITSLNSENTEERVAAKETISNIIRNDDKEIADVWDKFSGEAIENGVNIDIDTNFLDKTEEGQEGSNLSANLPQIPDRTLAGISAKQDFPDSPELQAVQDANLQATEEETLNAMVDTQESVVAQDEVKGRRQRFERAQEGAESDAALMNQFVDDAEAITQQSYPEILAQENANLHNSVKNKLQGNQPLSEEEEAYKQEYLQAQDEEKKVIAQRDKEKKAFLSYEDYSPQLPGEQEAIRAAQETGPVGVEQAGEDYAPVFPGADTGYAAGDQEVTPFLPGEKEKRFDELEGEFEEGGVPTTRRDEILGNKTVGDETTRKLAANEPLTPQEEEYRDELLDHQKDVAKQKKATDKKAAVDAKKRKEFLTYQGYDTETLDMSDEEYQARLDSGKPPVVEGAAKAPVFKPDLKAAGELAGEDTNLQAMAQAKSMGGISIESAKQMFSGDTYKELSKPGLFTKQGQSIDDIATQLDYGSAKELVDSWSTAPLKKDAVDSAIKEQQAEFDIAEDEQRKAPVQEQSPEDFKILADGLKADRYTMSDSDIEGTVSLSVGQKAELLGINNDLSQGKVSGKKQAKVDSDNGKGLQSRGGRVTDDKTVTPTPKQRPVVKPEPKTAPDKAKRSTATQQRKNFSTTYKKGDITTAAKNLSGSTNRRDINKKLDDIFGAESKDDPEVPANGKYTKMFDLAADYRADIEHAANNRNWKEVRSLLDALRNEERGDTPTTDTAKDGDVQPRSEVSDEGTSRVEVGGEITHNGKPYRFVGAAGKSVYLGGLGGREGVVVEPSEITDNNLLVTLATSEPEPKAPKSSMSVQEQKPVDTKSPEFKRWFGDSEVVDEDGEPLVVYHGTDVEFEAFDPEKSDDFGIHFGTKEQAGTFTEGDLIPVHLMIENPLELDFDITLVEPDSEKHIEGDYHTDLLRELSASMGEQDLHEWYRKNDRTFQVAIDIAEDLDVLSKKLYEEDDLRDLFGHKLLKSFHGSIGRIVESHGYDGVIYENELEGEGESYIVFNPTQIKSAISNTGEFSNTDPRILFKSTKDKQTIPPSEAADIKAELTKGLSATGLNRLLKNNVLEIVNQEQLQQFMAKYSTTMEVKYSREGWVEGFTHEGKAHLVEGNIANDQAMNVFAHELGVHLKELGFRESDQFKSITGMLKERAKFKNAEGKAIVEAMARVPKETNPAYHDEEVLAYLISNSPHISIVRRYIAAIKKFLVEKLGLTPRALKNIDLQALAINVLKREAATDLTPGAKAWQEINLKFSKSESPFMRVSPEMLKSSAFKKWFKKSRLVSKSGAPIKVYHGSPNEFYEFGKDKKEGSGHTSSGLGDFFTMDKSIAENYGAAKSFHLRMEHPYTMSLEEAQSFETRRESVKRKKELQDQGYDSILIKIPGKKEGSINPYLIVFEGGQVKSAELNTGEFSLTDDDVRYSKAQARATEAPVSIKNIMSTLRSASTTKADAIKYGVAKEQEMVGQYRKLGALAKDSHSSIATKQEAIASFLKVLPPKVRAKVITPLTLVSRFMRIGTHGKRMNEALVRAEKELTLHLRRGVIADIQTGVKPNKLAKSRVKKSTIGHEASRDLGFIRETLKEKDIAGKVAALDNQIFKKEQELEESGSKKTEEELADLESQRNILETFGDIKEQNLEDLLFAKEALASIIQEGRALWRAQQESFKDAMAHIIANVQQDISGQEDPTIETAAQATKRREQEGTAKGRAKKTWDAVENSILSWEFLMNKLSSLSGDKVLQSFTTKNMLNVAKKATDNEILFKSESDNDMHSKAMEVFDAKKNSDLNKKFMAQEVKKSGKVFAYNDTGKKLEDFTMSQQEAAYMYAIRKNDDSLPTFEAMNMTDRTFEEIERFIGPELKEFVDYNVDEYLQDFHFDVNQVYRQVYGTNLTKTPGYISWYRDLPGKVQDKGIASSPTESGTKGMSKGAFKERVKNTNPYRMMSFNDVLVRHVDEMNNFRAWAMPTKVINAVFNNRNTQRLITQHHGGNMAKNVKQFQADFTKSPMELRGDLPWLDKLRGNITTAMTALNPTIFLKQLTSIPAMAESIPTAAWVKNSGAFWANPMKAWNTLKDSKAWEGRRKMGMERDIRTAQAVSGSQAIANMQNLKNRAMFLVKWGDGAAILVGGFPVYKYHFDQNVKGMGKGKAHKFALDKFEKAMDRTQQASGIKDQGNIQRSGSYAKLFTMFITAPKQYTSQIIAAIRGIRSNPTDGDAYKRLFIFGVLMPALFKATATGMLGIIGGDDDDKEKVVMDQIKAIATAPLNGIPIIRDLQNAVWESAMGNWYGKNVDFSPATQSASSLMGAIFHGAKLFADEADGDRSKHAKLALTDLWETVGYATGLPANTVRKMVFENWTDVVTGQTDYHIRRALGFSRAAMGERGSRFERNLKSIKGAMKRRKEKETRNEDTSLLRLVGSMKSTEKVTRKLRKKLTVAEDAGRTKAVERIKDRIRNVQRGFNRRFNRVVNS